MPTYFSFYFCHSFKPGTSIKKMLWGAIFNLIFVLEDNL